MRFVTGRVNARAVIPQVLDRLGERSFGLADDDRKTVFTRA
ncbi:hypothetical protein [Mycobacterium gastri]|nr:hypothetical protein [Mycobacterium gastri]